LRNLIIGAGLLALAAPAAAQSDSRDRDDDIVRKLPPPGQIEEMGDRMGQVADAIMDVPVGPIADAVDPHRRHHPNETLGDVASRGDPYARERVRDDIARATYGLTAALEQFAVVTPVLRRSLEDAARRIEDAMDDRRPPHRGPDRDRDDRYDEDYDGPR
jgi:hypothetical protein